MGTHASLDTVREASTILGAIRAADDLAVAAARDGGARAVRLLTAAAEDASDTVTAIAAIHALAPIMDDEAGDALVALLERPEPAIREHSAWALALRLPRLDAVIDLTAMTADGGFAGMIAQRTLEQWSTSVPDHIALALQGAMITESDPSRLARLVETLGLIPGRTSTRTLRRTALDSAQALEVREAAVAALGDREATPAIVEVVAELAYRDDDLSPVARLALFDLTLPSRPAPHSGGGLTIGQLYLHADIDGALSQVGSGDNGGIATLLVRLGDAMIAGEGRTSRQAHTATGPGVSRVLTLSRGSSADALEDLSSHALAGPGHHFAAVPYSGDAVPSSAAWPRRVASERGIRRALRAAGRVDALHLRMADVGSYAAASVARELDIPVVFTVAPDPHSVIDAKERSGVLTRENFAEADGVEHFWFRARLVQRLAADAAHTVLFPRPELATDISRLIGIDITEHPERHTVVAEGIDLSVLERSRTDVILAEMGAPGTDINALDGLLSTLPEERRSLPIAITVGRLHPVKGMSTLVEAWSRDAALRERCNLLVVGGDLAAPSADESSQLAAIARAVPAGSAAGLLLAGHRSNDTVTRWLAATVRGREGYAAPGGVYVCASVKEEFGLAILEAMASGLTVVAPSGGGPATYVEDGATGILVTTTDHAALSAAVSKALDISGSEWAAEYSDRAIAMVTERFTIQTMATALATVYTDVAAAKLLEHSEMSSR